MLATAAVAKSGITVEELRASAFHSWPFQLSLRYGHLLTIADASAPAATLWIHAGQMRTAAAQTSLSEFLDVYLAEKLRALHARVRRAARRLC